MCNIWEQEGSLHRWRTREHRNQSHERTMNKVGQQKDNALKNIGGIIENSKTNGYSNKITYRKLVTKQPLCSLMTANKNGRYEELK
jgi:hypothetical protein